MPRLGKLYVTQLNMHVDDLLINKLYSCQQHCPVCRTWSIITNTPLRNNLDPGEQKTTKLSRKTDKRIKY